MCCVCKKIIKGQGVPKNSIRTYGAAFGLCSYRQFAADPKPEPRYLTPVSLRPCLCDGFRSRSSGARYVGSRPCDLNPESCGNPIPQHSLAACCVSRADEVHPGPTTATRSFCCLGTVVLAGSPATQRAKNLDSLSKDLV